MRSQGSEADVFQLENEKDVLLLQVYHDLRSLYVLSLSISPLSPSRPSLFSFFSLLLPSFSLLRQVIYCPSSSPSWSGYLFSFFLTGCYIEWREEIKEKKSETDEGRARVVDDVKRVLNEGKKREMMILEAKSEKRERQRRKERMKWKKRSCDDGNREEGSLSHRSYSSLIIIILLLCLPVTLCCSFHPFH